MFDCKFCKTTLLYMDHFTLFYIHVGDFGWHYIGVCWLINFAKATFLAFFNSSKL